MRAKAYLRQILLTPSQTTVAKLYLLILISVALVFTSFADLSNDSGLLTFVQELQANPSAPLNMEDIPEVYPNLRLLPSGGKTRTTTELLEKMAFTNLMIKLKREFDVLLLDSSPVGLFPDSNALATKVDDLILSLDTQRWGGVLPSQCYKT